MEPEDWKIYSDNNFISAFRLKFSTEVELLKNNLHIMHYGITLCEIKGRDLIPHTSLALSKSINTEKIQQAEVELRDALLYLKKEAINLPDAEKGFILVKYQNIPLGWVKNIGNRTNNLYPNEWRIRMKI